MGTYTEFHFKVKLAYDAPEEIILFLNDMMDYSKGDYPCPIPPDHELFDCERWENLFFASAYYERYPRPSFKLLGGPGRSGVFVMDVDPHVGRTWVLELHGELKNYDSEIQKFAEWISPYVKKSRKKKPTYLGWSKVECSENQQHYHVGGDYVYRPEKREVKV